MRLVRRLTILPALAGILLWAAQASAQAQTGTITGRVVDGSTQRPLAAASVVIEGTQRGIVTRADGAFLLPNVPAGTHRLRASQVGYGNQVVEVTVAAGQSATAQFALQPQAVQLDELVAVGYGTQRRRDVTGAVAVVSGEDLTVRAAPTSAVSNALQGKAPGVQVVTNSGIPGAGASVRIRGSNSITANSEPLYVIDGIPAAQGTGSQDPTFNPLNSIDPNSIESIQILKDASATAIYGARGANGVVLITTNRGRVGENQFTLESSYGQQSITRRINPLSAQDFMTLVNEAYVNAGRDIRYTQQQINSAQSYNYVDMMIRDGAPQQAHSLTFSGGDERTRFLVSGNYVEQEGILVNSHFQRYGARFNLDRHMSDRFRLGNSLSLTHAEQGLNRTDNGGIGASANGILGAMNFDPSLAPRNENGQWNMRAVLGEQLENPLANSLEIQNPRRVSRALANVYGELDVTPALRLRSTLGGNFAFERTPEFRPRTSPAGVNDNGWARIYSSQTRELTSENTATYRRDLGPGSIDVLGGFSIQTSQWEDQASAARGFPNDGFRWNNLGAGATRTELGSNASDWTLISNIGRVNYNLYDRYLFTVTGRRDGSSRFGANNKWAFFPSAAFAWRLSEEAFLKDQTLFDDLKLRLSYGATGNQAVNEYQSLARLGTVHVGIGRNAEAVTLAPAGSAPNPDLRWETTRSFNAGLDAAIMQGRVTMSLDAYQSRTSDLLLFVPLPRMSGFTNQLQNIGSVENRGVEFTLSTVNVQGANFGWRSTLNLAANRNKVVDLGEVTEIDPGTSRFGWFLGNQSSHIVRVGHSLGSFYGYKVDGLFQQGDNCYLTNTALCAPGEYRVQDTNGDGRIDANDRVILGTAEPKFYGGVNNGFNYGPLSLDAFVNFSYGNKVANLGRVFTEMSTGFLNENERVLNRWTPTNTNTDIPRANNARQRLLYSPFIEDGSFLRLQSLTLGYQVPQGLVPGTSSARLFLTGQNLLTLSGYSGFDPEVNSLGGDARFAGLDVGAFPRARIWNVGVNVTF
jgi:TonB-dependent starch-binding outer membrane protein SusC